MKRFTLFIFCFIAISGVAQTRLISHKSHSGSTATFSTALENSLFDIGASNFGEPSSERRFTIDSIILQPDNSAVVVSSEKNVWVTASQSKIGFRPGRDTLYNHPLLSKQHAIDSIKRQLWFEANNIKFVNYDNIKPQAVKKEEPKKNTFFAVPSGDDNFPAKPMLVFAVTLLSGLIAFVSYYFYKVKNTRAIT
jgi:hypothetical protein